MKRGLPMKTNSTLTFTRALDNKGKTQLLITFNGKPTLRDMYRISCTTAKKIARTKQKQAPSQFMYHEHNKRVTALIGSRCRRADNEEYISNLFADFAHEDTALDVIQDCATALTDLLQPMLSDKPTADTMTIRLYDVYILAFDGYAPKSKPMPKLTDTDNDFDVCSLDGTKEQHMIDTLCARYDVNITQSQRVIFTLYAMGYNATTIAYKLEKSQPSVSRTINQLKTKLHK